MAQQNAGEPLDLDHIRSEIAPAFTFRTAFVGAISALVSAFAAFGQGDFVPALVLLPLAAAVLWCYFDTWYALRDDRLYIHFGPFRHTVRYAELRAVSIPFSYRALTLWGLSHDCIELRVGRGLLRTVCISPKKQYRVFDLLCARCPALDER